MTATFDKPAKLSIITSENKTAPKKKPAYNGRFRSDQTTPQGGAILSDIVHQDVKVVKPPDLIFLQFGEDDVPDTFCVDKVNDRDVLYLRLDLIKETFKTAMLNDDEVLPLWDILSALTVREQGQLPSIHQPCVICERSGTRIHLEMTDQGWMCQRCRPQADRGEGQGVGDG